MRALWFCVALMPVLAQADIYRWTDAQGKVHFSATPPAGAQRVEVRPQVVERDAATRQREQRTQEYFDARREERTAAAERAGQRQAALAEECGACGNSCPSSNAAAASIGRTPAAGRFT